MPPKKNSRHSKTTAASPKVKGVIEGAGEIVQQKIAETIEENYMPYAMSVILSRAIPEIDGFKPSHRKLLYTMYKMGLLNGSRTKSANIVGQTMRLNPHGDSAIYDTMVRLSRGYEALLHPYIDSKGNFGKFYSRDMAWAASRYTEAKLDPICSELFKDIDRDTVDFVDNYDNTMKEPALLPASYPSVLVNANTGIAVGMASSICSFNLKEVCDTTAALIKDSQHDISSTMPAPDFSGGGQIIYDKKVFDEMLRISTNQIICGGNYFALPPTRCFIVWDKQISPDFSLAMAEYFWTSFDRLAKIYRMPSEKGERIHPTQKPLKLFETILSDYSKENDLVLDCFSGSGTTAVACHNLKRRFICIEKDPEYWKASCERLEQAQRQQTLF